MLRGAPLLAPITRRCSCTRTSYAADASGDLRATLPPVFPHGTLHVCATDRGPVPGDPAGPRWTDT